MLDKFGNKVILIYKFNFLAGNFMEYILKVNPKGQVTLPKKLRERLDIQNLLSVDLQEGRGVLKKASKKSDDLAGSFSPYYRMKKIPLDKARTMALELTADEISRKNR
jgi:AbrB family looped-hinge helix DNA binding protein